MRAARVQRRSGIKTPLGTYTVLLFKQITIFELTVRVILIDQLMVLCRKTSDFLFFGITGLVLFAFHDNIRDSQERKWQRQIRDIEMRTYMMDKKEDELNSSFH